MYIQLLNNILIKKIKKAAKMRLFLFDNKLNVAYLAAKTFEKPSSVFTKNSTCDVGLTPTNL
jgi:hypothetical protein